MTCPLITKLQNDLTLSILPTYLKLEDQSANHRGHVGFQEGQLSHLKVTISSPLLQALSSVQQHRLLYQHIKESIGSIHSVSLKVLPMTP